MPPLEVSALRTAAHTLGVDLDDAQAERLLGYRDLIAKWNRVYNLTAVRDPQAMVVQHLLDSLAVVAPLRRHTQGRATRVLDVGSGAGLPGVVIALTCPEIDVTCVDTVNKKVSFIRQAGIELGLKNLHAVQTAVEQWHAPGFGVITARAFSSLQDLVRWSRHLLEPNGVWMAMKGADPDGERQALSGATVFHVEPLEIPGLDAQRCLVWMRPD